MTETVVLLAAAATATASPSARFITGLAVPYGKVGHSAFGDLTFAAGSLTWSEPGRVKLLVQHDQNRSVGYATELRESDDGLHATFHVPPAPEDFMGGVWPGDEALAAAANGTKDGLSVGVLLDADTIDALMHKMIDGDTEPTAASGVLLEVSQVSVPAFDDARVPSAASASVDGLLTMAVTFGPVTPSNPAPVAPSNPPPKEIEMTVTTTAAPPQAPVQDTVVEQAAPTPSPFAGGFQTTRVEPIYTFDGNGHSFVRDMWHARFDQDLDAQQRVHQFNRLWQAQEAGQVTPFLTAAVETRTTAPNWIQQGYAPSLLVETIDKGRPIVARVGTVNLTDATPFRIPIEGDFTAVGDHTEGTAHAAEGDLTIGDTTVTPGAISGAYRLSRELIDASNPAIDTMASRAMLRDYRRATEVKAVAALDAADSTATASINTLIEVRAQLNAYYDTNFEDATGIAASPSWYGTLVSEVDTTGRAMLSEIGPTNAIGTPQAGFTGAVVSGTEIFKAYAVAATMAYLYNAADFFIGESSVLSFRFEEIEGPGVVKLALWSYFAAKVVRAGSVVKVTST